MCGITGILHLNNAPLHQEKLIKFTDSLKHRGPDGEGYFIDKIFPLGLGHRRLSILDLSVNAAQPMSFADERYWMVYNGEVFNFLEIKHELELKGYTFKTQSDSEVILTAYHHWGATCLHKFNGMWSMAIWDTLKQELFLSRDRFGIKPLYYLYIPNHIFAFASETYAFKFLEDYRREWNKAHLQIAIQNAFALEGKGHTVFQNMYQVLGGHYININIKNFKIEQKRWWNTLEKTPQIPESYDKQVEAFYEILENAALLRLRSDVPIASALSGGVDSSAVYCVLNQIHHNQTIQKLRLPENWQEAFIATFPNTIMDERSYAEQVIDYTQGKATYITPDYDTLLQDILKATEMFDCIYFTPLNIVGDIYKKMYQHGYKISLDGHGVDEMLLGYPDFSETAIKYALQQGNKEAAEDYWNTYSHLFPLEVQEKLQKPLLEPNKASMLLSLYQNLMPEFVKNLYRKSKNIIRSNHKIHDEQNHQNWFYNTALKQTQTLSNKPIDTSSWNIVDQSLHEAFHLTILPTILRNFDRASMQNSIEVRMPFMDYRLVSFVFALPLESKIGEGFTKKILRDAMKNKMPESIRTRKLKIGLNAPMIEWFNGQMASFILDEVNSEAFKHSDLWNGKVIANFVEKTTKNKTWTLQQACQLWNVMSAHLLSHKDSK